MRATDPALFGLVAEFEDHHALLKAARAAHEFGFRKFEAYSPFPIEEMPRAIGFPRNRVALCGLLGGLGGGIGGYFMQWYAMAVDYPLNIGGRPLHSIPSFIPITFELTVLGSALAAVLGMLALNGLPRPHHPIFAAKNFARASTDKFFLCIESGDPRFERGAVELFLREQNARDISEVPAA